MIEEKPMNNQNKEKNMLSLNHSYICSQILKQLFKIDQIEPLVKLTLNIGNGITPDISVFNKDKISFNFLRDVTKKAKELNKVMLTGNLRGNSVSCY
jgi:hypothetical protein